MLDTWGKTTSKISKDTSLLDLKSPKGKTAAITGNGYDKFYHKRSSKSYRKPEPRARRFMDHFSEEMTFNLTPKSW